MKASPRFVVWLALLSISVVLVFEPRSLAQEQSASDPVYEIHKVGDYGVTAPKPLYHPDPEYTDRARKKKISGTVLLSIVVTPEGTVRDAKVTTSLDKDLDQQALNTVNTWKFQPATKDDKPVSVRLAVEMTFRIQ
jgi:periplasmic protein TonB